MGGQLGGVKEGRGEFDFTCPLLSDFRGIVVESAAALSRSALQTQGSGYCAARWGRPEAGRAFQPGLSVTLENWCGKSVHSHPESRGE